MSQHTELKIDIDVHREWGRGCHWGLMGAVLGLLTGGGGCLKEE